MIELGFALGKSLDEMYEMPSDMLTLYRAYCAEHPLDDPWMRNATQLALQEMIHGKKGTRFEPEKWLPIRKEKRYKSWQEQLAIAKSLSGGVRSQKLESSR